MRGTCHDSLLDAGIIARFIPRVYKGLCTGSFKAWLRLLFKLALNIKYLTRSKIWIESEEQAGSRSTAVAIETPTVTLTLLQPIRGRVEANADMRGQKLGQAGSYRHTYIQTHIQTPL